MRVRSVRDKDTSFRLNSDLNDEDEIFAIDSEVAVMEMLKDKEYKPRNFF